MFGRTAQVGRRHVIGKPAIRSAASDPRKKQNDSVLHIDSVAGGYVAEVGPPHSEEPWASPPLSATDLLGELSKRGCHSTDVTDALDATGRDWRTEHDETVLRRRAVESWFRERGLGVETKRDADGSYWASLTSLPSGRVVAPDYGHGPTAVEAVESAKERHQKEQ